MIGIIVTGHGTFADGLTSGIKLLMGEQEAYQAVNFSPEDSIEILTGNLTKALDALKDCEGVLMLTDLAGGSPFNVSVRLKLEYEMPIEVVGGTNLPILLDACISRMSITDVGELVEASMAEGKEQTIRYVQEQAQSLDEDEIEFDD